METLLIPRLVLPYLDKCVIHATVLNTRAEAYSDMLEVSMHIHACTVCMYVCICV